VRRRRLVGRPRGGGGGYEDGGIVARSGWSRGGVAVAEEQERGHSGANRQGRSGVGRAGWEGRK
jgi:hypothetical protein